MPPKNSVLSFRLKDPGGVLNYDGALAKGLELLFSRLPDALARRKVLHQLEQDHAKFLRMESGADLDADQQTAAQVAALGHQVHPLMALPSLTPEGHAARLATCETRDQGSSYHAFCTDPNCAACYGVKP